MYRNNVVATVTVCEEFSAHDNQVPKKLSGLAIKRGTDIVLAASALILLFPIMLLLAALVRLTSGSPVIFRQLRVGLNGRIFVILKFRTMHNGSPYLVKQAVRDGAAEKYKTPFGRFLRRYSLDELPQLLNVLKGDMSLVGPRPDPPDTYRTRLREQYRVLKFKPGLTGLAQIEGRGDLDDAQTVDADRRYCQNWSYGWDWRILFATASTVLTKRGAY